MLSKEKPVWQQVLAQASIFCLKLEAVKLPGVGELGGTCSLAAVLALEGKQQGLPAELLAWAVVGGEGCRCVLGAPVGTTGQEWGLRA